MGLSPSLPSLRIDDSAVQTNTNEIQIIISGVIQIIMKYSRLLKIEDSIYLIFECETYSWEFRAKIILDAQENNT